MFSTAVLTRAEHAVMKRLAAAARVGFEGKVPGPEEYKFRLFIEMEVSQSFPPVVSRPLSSECRLEVERATAPGCEGGTRHLEHEGKLTGPLSRHRLTRRMRSTLG